jgi:serine phosphatase RsbU (regulator of sigma subunit)
VSGHGLGAALFVATVRSALRSACQEGLAPGEVLERLNVVVFDLAGETGLFATARVIELSGRAGRTAAAAHPPAFILDPAGAVRRIGNAGPPAGALAQASFPEVEFELMPAETLLLYTDGVFDARAGGVSELEARVRAWATADPGTLVERLLARESPARGSDDRTAVALMRRDDRAP